MSSLPGFDEGGELLPFDGSAVLHPCFLGPDEADSVLRRLIDDEPWESHAISMFGRRVPEPRLSVWHGDAGAAYVYSGVPRVPLPWTELLGDLRTRCATAAGSTFNGVLVNLYRDGSDSMGWHADDEPVLGPEPVIASLSLGAERRFDLRHRESGRTVSRVLPHGSLLLMTGPTQARWVHRVARTTRIASPRVNLTFRRLLWTS